MFRSRLVFVRETRVESALRSLCMLIDGCVLTAVKVEKALECAGSKRGRRISRDVKRVV